MEYEENNSSKILEEQPTAFPAMLVSIFEWMEAIIVSFVIIVLAFTFLFRVVSVDGISMNVTLQDKDRVLVWSLFYQPHRGDVVVITNATSQKIPIIKRVIGLGGDTVHINYETGETFVNGSKALPENYLFEPMRPLGDEMVTEQYVPYGQVFVMGDNRNNSEDSRGKTVGMIKTQNIMGKAVFRIFPFSSFGKIESPELDAYVDAVERN